MSDSRLSIVSLRLTLGQITFRGASSVTVEAPAEAADAALIAAAANAFAALAKTAGANVLGTLALSAKPCASK